MTNSQGVKYITNVTRNFLFQKPNVVIKKQYTGKDGVWKTVKCYISFL